MKLYANLHNHTTHSDGVWTPEELVSVAKKEGYRALAAADHDTATAYPELEKACLREGIEPVFAVEFTALSEFRRDMYHIVGIGFDPSYPPMADYLRRRSECETDQTKKLFDRGLESGYLHDITWNDVLDFCGSITWICNEQVFRVMKKKGLAVDTDYYDFFNTVYGVHRGEIPPLHPYLKSDDMIKLIRDAGGIAVLAHPHCQLGDVARLKESGLEGIEVWHADVPFDEQISALEIARDEGLFVSGGEDHSGLCGGQYARYVNPKDSPHYVPELSCGTTEYLFREITARRLNPGRVSEINRLLGLMHEEKQ